MTSEVSTLEKIGLPKYRLLLNSRHTVIQYVIDYENDYMRI